MCLTLTLTLWSLTLTLTLSLTRSGSTLKHYELRNELRYEQYIRNEKRAS